MIRILPSQLNGTLNAPASTDHAQKLLFAAAMPPVPTVVKNVPESDDISATVACLEAFGCKIAVNGREYTVDPFAKNLPMPTADFDFRDSTITSLIAICMAGALGYKAECRADQNLSKRHLVTLSSRMALRGVRFSSFSLPLSLSGRLTPGEYSFDSEFDGQYIGAMLMALPLLSGDSTIVVGVPQSDEAPVLQSIDVLERFGIAVEKTDNGYFVKGRQQYVSPGSVAAENDWVFASLWTAAAAVCRGSVTVTGLSENSPQKKYRDTKALLSMLSQDFEELRLSAADCPELAMFFAALAAVKGAVFSIDGISQLRALESDSLRIMSDCVRALGGTAELSDDNYTVRGLMVDRFPESQVLDCKGDPWVFMSFALASAVLKKPLTLSDENGAGRLYKNFLSDFALLGGQYKTL